MGVYLLIWFDWKYTNQSESVIGIEKNYLMKVDGGISSSCGSARMCDRGEPARNYTQLS